MARLIGTELIEKAEVSKYIIRFIFIFKDLRQQLNSMTEILMDMEEQQES